MTIHSVQRSLLRKLGKFPLAKRVPLIAWHSPFDVRALATENSTDAIRCVRKPYTAQNRLPMNVEDYDDLPGLVPPSVTYYSFRDVARLNVEGSYLLKFEDCWILRKRHRWGGSDFAICNNSGQLLRLTGLLCDVTDKTMRELLGRAKTGEHETLDDVTWALGCWYYNYYHWSVEWLPRIVLALDAGLPPQSILLPTSLGPWAMDSLRLLGLSPRWMSEDCNAWRVKRLTLVSESKHHGGGHDAVKRRLSTNVHCSPGAGKKIWISRRDASWRNLREEPEIELWLSQRGWHPTKMEQLSLEEQIKVMANVEAIAGVHGAGFTNMIFAARNVPVLEIGLRERPNPDFYALASSLNHPYWYVRGNKAGKNEDIAYDDLVVCVDEVKRAIIDLEKFLEQRKL